MIPLVVIGLGICALAGCGGARLQVNDASTGYVISGAIIEADLRDGRMVRLATTGSDGSARIAPPPGADRLAIRAAGYRPTTARPGVTSVALQPAWLGAFMDGGATPRPDSDHAHAPRRPCNCRTAR
ncbi:MAG: carboxypeptidase regulatory-like domain-containing protein [Planctomycetes bacterium]|nr:carboxypeptidase regulatory-like domain-containing protein [Planctomycetota bacterium]